MTSAIVSPVIGTSGQQKFREELIHHGHLLPSGEPGVYGRGMVFEDVRNRFDDLVTRVCAPDKPETPRFPPIIPRRTLERAGYLRSFPQLCGVVHSFAGNEAAALDMAERASRGDDWSHHLSTTDVVLVPAACYPAYPAMALRGPLPKGGLRSISVDVTSFGMSRRAIRRGCKCSTSAKWCASAKPRKFSPGAKPGWIAPKGFLNRCGLDATLAVASDPFFGRGGKLMANNQREQGLKFEVLVPIASPEPTAVSSFNFHQDHFGSAFGIQLHDGTVANSACLGFGLERITLALFRAHGMDAGDWPKGRPRTACGRQASVR